MRIPVNYQKIKIMIMLNRSYHFAVHNNGTKVEELGDMELNGDAAALSFGKLVIQELIHKNAAYYSGWIMNITEDKRTVGSVPIP